MVEHWITPAQALEIGADSDAILSRLANGAVRARADRISLDGEIERAYNLPAELWVVDRFTDVRDDWEAGDFSRDGNDSWEATDVRFALADVLRLLPVESRAIAARQLSVESNPAWLTARAARQLVYQTEGVNPAAAGPLLLQRAALGFVSARAVKAEGATVLAYSTLKDPWEFREWDVPADFWETFAGSSGSQNWELGNFHQRDTHRKGMEFFLLTGVHFLASSVSGGLPAPETSAVAKGGRGRPPIDEMEGILIDVFADIY